MLLGGLIQFQAIKFESNIFGGIDPAEAIFTGLSNFQGFCCLSRF